MVNKVLLFLDTESTIFENERVIYDLSITVIEYNQYASNVPFDKKLRNRNIEGPKKVFTKLNEKNLLIYEYAHLIPNSKKVTYGYADYRYTSFEDSVKIFKILCDYYKPDAILGYNVQADFDAIKNTQKVLKTSPDIYMKNNRISSDSLFKKGICNGFDFAYKTDIMLYLSNHCPNFMNLQEKFAIENELFTEKGFLSRKLIDMYRYSTQNPNIEQLHMGYYDNMYAIQCIEKSIKTDGFKYFPQFCMTQNDRKRRHCDDVTDSKLKRKFHDNTSTHSGEQKKIKYQYDSIPNWFNDQFKNSRCLKNESVEDIRRYHPDFGGTNKQSAPYFRGETSRAGISPPNYIY